MVVNKHKPRLKRIFIDDQWIWECKSFYIWKGHYPFFAYGPSPKRAYDKWLNIVRTELGSCA